MSRHARQMSVRVRLLPRGHDLPRRCGRAGDFRDSNRSDYVLQALQRFRRQARKVLLPQDRDCLPTQVRRLTIFCQILLRRR